MSDSPGTKIKTTEVGTDTRHYYGLPGKRHGSDNGQKARTPPRITSRHYEERPKLRSRIARILDDHLAEAIMYHLVIRSTNARGKCTLISPLAVWDEGAVAYTITWTEDGGDQPVSIPRDPRPLPRLG